MRSVLTVSVSKEILNKIKKMTKDGGFSSVSEFCRFAIRSYLEKLKKERKYD